MKTLSILISFIFIIIFSPNLVAQTCNSDSDYYYQNNDRNRYHNKRQKSHYKRNYRHDRKSIKDFRRRIDQGVRSGELTRNEERKLKRELNKLVRYENKAYSNGYISRHERRKIERIKSNLDDLIYQKKHNRHRWN